LDCVPDVDKSDFVKVLGSAGSVKERRELPWIEPLLFFEFVDEEDEEYKREEE